MTTLDNTNTESQAAPASSETGTNAAASASEASTGSSNFMDNIPEDLRAEPCLQSVKDVGSLAKGFVSAQRMLGGRIPIPTEDASPEAKAEFYSKLSSVKGVVRLPEESDPDSEKLMADVYTKLGRPPTPDHYKIELPSDLPENLPVDQEYIANIKETAHKVGLNQKQLDALAAIEIQRTKDMLEIMKQQQTNCDKYLRKQWGNAFEEKTALAKGLLDNYRKSYPNEANELAASAASNNPIVLMAFAELGGIYHEKGTIMPRNSSPVSRTPEQARQQLADIYSNKGHAYFNARDPGHDLAVQKVQQLTQDAYPEQKVDG